MDVLNRDTLEFRASVNTPDFPHPAWILSPDMSGVAGVPRRYWKLVGDAPVSMSQAEIDVVDAAALEAEKDGIEASFSGRNLAGALARITFSEINLLRVEAGLAPRTVAQFKAALRGELNGNG